MEEEEAPGGCAGEEDGEITDGGGAVWSRKDSCRSVSFSEASSCRSRRTLVSSLVRVSSRCLN